jgi:hypothetical protein
MNYRPFLSLLLLMPSAALAQGASVPVVPTQVTKVSRMTGKSLPGETIPNPNRPTSATR